MTANAKNARTPASKPPRPAAKSANTAGDLLGLDEAVAMLKTTRPTFYRWLRSGKIKGMKLGRQWRFQKDDVERFLKGQAPLIDLPADITPLIRSLSTRITDAGGKVPAGGDGSETHRAVTLMIALSSLMNASDIHITCHLEGTETAAVVRFRIDGILHEFARIDPRLHKAVVEEWKRMAGCLVHELEKPQDGRILIKVGDGAAEKALDVRVAFLPAGLGESVTGRILDRGAVDLRLDRFDYAPRDLAGIRRALHAPSGMIAVTGPSGCGKTTFLYSCLMELSSPEWKAMSIEDPVEFFLPWVTQVHVNERTGMTFARAVRSMLRSDPDVLMVGEIRDPETLLTCIQAAMTGHIVLTNLHAEDAALALKRMIDLKLDPFVVADATKLVVSQRLVRKLCTHCAVEGSPDAATLDRAAQAARLGGLDWPSLEKRFRKPVGCDRCAKTGFRGRTAIAEALEVTGEIGRALRNGATADELRTIAVGQGMTTMAAHGIRRAAAGETTLDEILRVTG